MVYIGRSPLESLGSAASQVMILRASLQLLRVTISESAERFRWESDDRPVRQSSPPAPREGRSAGL